MSADAWFRFVLDHPSDAAKQLAELIAWKEQATNNLHEMRELIIKLNEKVGLA